MSRTFVRTLWASDINHAARQVLQELADVDSAAVSAAPTDMAEETLNIQHQTALSLVRKGYVEIVDDNRVAITREGLIKIGRIVISRAERRRRKEAESLRAQASGEWQPAPAGHSAQAQQDHVAARRAFAQAGAEVGEARDHLNWTRDMLRTSREWGAGEAELKACQEEIDAAKKRLAALETQRDSLDHAA